MSSLKTPLEPALPTNTWIATSWEDYLQMIAEPTLAKAKGYYHQNHMRIEMSPVGHDHAADNALIDFAVQLFCTVRGIAFKGLVNCSYRQAGVRECQPDSSYYLREQAQVIPWGTTVVDLNRYPAPDLVIEIAAASLLDDQGNKRSLYEALGVKEYWVVDVRGMTVLAYALTPQGSQRLDASQVLGGLQIEVLATALERSRQQDQGQVGAWLLQEFSGA
ncbi:Uma2 family endonuclease [Roseofilum sp. BLCC_M154]|uniref:Uma2 family endonuclease n=1 Tax=Roseofilum acuticapitatum BLCC-M154 TaxID=3022444 RepID=A0ABT7ATY0_9CYAN|nr:Uma2 family endonuclease [Roseofilum acuticapitatum]MDJ1170373.1 Uma2 family endonuclease [Roseofilum acuticapitatum BLCC-M154]